jgi:DNA-binding response OmpR family regulator
LKPRVFLVEDEDLIAMFAEEILGELGYDVVASAATLAQGSTLAESADIDVALLDVNLRGLQSFQSRTFLRLGAYRSYLRAATGFRQPRRAFPAWS